MKDLLSNNKTLYHSIKIIGCFIAIFIDISFSFIVFLAAEIFAIKGKLF